MSDRILLTGAAALALFAPCAAGAQPADGETAADVLAATPAPSASEPVSALSAFSVEGGQDGTSATLKFGAQRNQVLWLGAGAAEGQFRTASVALSAPLEKKRDFTSPLTQDGLVNAASVALQFSEMLIPGADMSAVNEGGTVCATILATYRQRNPAAPAADCHTAAYSPGNEDLARAYNAGVNDAFGRRLLQYRGLFGKVGHQNYVFYDPVTLTRRDVDRTPWRAGAFYAWIGGREDWAVTAQYAHEEAFQEADPRTACLSGSSPALDCVTGALARPQRVSKDILSIEARWVPGQVSLGVADAKFGLAPKVAYDANNDHWAVGLPIYLFGDKTGLTGGVRADWESRDHDIVVGVFLTKTFSISDGL